MNWTTILAYLENLQPALIPSEIAALQSLQAETTNPLVVAMLGAVIAALQAQLPPAPTPAP